MKQKDKTAKTSGVLKSTIDLVLKKVGLGVSIVGVALFFIAGGLLIADKACEEKNFGIAATTVMSTSIASYCSGLAMVEICGRKFVKDKTSEILDGVPAKKNKEKEK